MREYSIHIDDYLNPEIKVVVFGEGKPEVLITGGIHGGESTGIYAAGRIIEHLTSNEPLQGSVKVIAVSNTTAFRRLERTSPYDNLDLNRIFPGDAKGSLSQKVAAAIWQEAQSADYIVDLHCCGEYGFSYTLALWQEYDYAKELALMLDIPIAVQSGGNPGQLFVETCKQGRPAVIIELPGGGQYGAINIDAGEQAANAIIGMLGQLEMLSIDVTSSKPQLCDKLIPLRAQNDGMFVAIRKAGKVVEQGEVIGKLNDVEITAPKRGTLTGMRPTSYVFGGTYLARIAPHIGE